MKIMVINGSHRLNGYSTEFDKLVTNLLSEKIEKCRIIHYNIRDLTFSYCDACGFCDMTGRCKMKDDANELIEKTADCRCLVFISPVYFNGVTSRLKALIDRGQYLFFSPRERRKKALVILVGGAKEYDGQFSGAKLEMSCFLKTLGVKEISWALISGTDDFQGKAPKETEALVNASVNRFLSGV